MAKVLIYKFDFLFLITESIEWIHNIFIPSKNCNVDCVDNLFGSNMGF